MAQSSVQSVDRALTMLWAVCRNPGRSLSELANLVDVMPSTALRLLTTLEGHELLDRDNTTRRYRLGAGVFRLAGIVNIAHEEIRVRLEPRLRELAGIVHEQVAVGVLDGTSQVNIAIIDGARDAGEEVLLRSDGNQRRHNLNATAVGKILLAYAAGDDKRDEIIDQLAFEQTAGHTIINPQRLRRHLAQVRKSGYATCIDENRPDVCGVAAPLFGLNEQLIAALCINGPANRLPPDRLRALLPVLRKTAGECSEILARMEPLSAI
jgi:DNA-binding IclR family transcriptional regulator